MKNKTWTKIWEIVLPVLLYYLTSNLVIMILISLVQGNFLGAVVQEHILNNWVLYSAVIKMAGMLLGGLVTYRCYRNAIPAGNEKRNNRLSIRATGMICVSGAVTGLLLNLFFSALHITQSSESYSKVAEIQFALPLWLAMIFYGVVSPVVEELVFRGIIFNKMKEHYSLIIAVVGSAVMFGAFHGNLVQGVYGSLMGILMALTYQRYEKLSAPVLFHSAANTAVYCMIFIQSAY